MLLFVWTRKHLGLGLFWAGVPGSVSPWADRP